MLPTAGTVPVFGSGLRSPLHTASKIFSVLLPFLVLILMTWMRSRLPLCGSFTACRRKVGPPLPAGADKSPPMGTPSAYALLTHSEFFTRSLGYFHPANIRTLMRTPDVPNVSLRLNAAKIDSRVFSSAHTPVRPPEESATGGSPTTDLVAVTTVRGSLSWLPCDPA